MLHTVAEVALIFFVMLFAFVAIALFAAIAFAIKKIEQLIEQLTDKADPIIAKVTNTLDTVQRITINVGEKADSILTKGEALTDTVADTVGKTATTVQATVTSPLIKFSSILSGVSAGLSVWSRSAASRAQAGVKATGRTQEKNGAAPAEEQTVVMPNGR